MRQWNDTLDHSCPVAILIGTDLHTGPSFSLRNRFARACWNIVYVLLFRPSPRALRGWRRFLLRAFGATVGHGSRVYPAVRIWAPWNLKLGRYVVVGDNAILYDMALMEIGDYSVISQGAHLCGGTHDYNSQNFQLVAKPICIGARAWICAEAFIHPGVSVAEGVVVGARAVVHQDVVDPWTVHAGNPLRRVGARAQAPAPILSQV